MLRAVWGYFRQNRLALAAIAVVAWISHYLHFLSFGLYADDWYYIAFPFQCRVQDWMITALRANLQPENIQGRPLQAIFGYTFAEIGAWSGTLAVDYLIAYVLYTVCAMLMYEVLRHRFTERVALLAAIIAVLSPLHTLHQFLNGQFSFAPSFLFVFAAMILYLNGKRTASYLVAAPALLCYESIFFLFLPVPLLKPGPMFRGRKREWTTHLAAIATTVVVYSVARTWMGEKRAAGLPHRFELLWSVVYQWAFFSTTSFLNYAHAVLRLHEASLEAWILAAVFCALAWIWLARGESEAQKQPIASIAVALIFLASGFLLSYFFEMDPHPKPILTDRSTRVHVAGVFGSSLLIAILIDQFLRLRSRIAPALAAAALGILFVYALVIQNDYVEDWQDQRSEIAQILALTPDAKPDSLIMLNLIHPDQKFQLTGRRPRGIGYERTVFEWHLPRLCPYGTTCPQLLTAYAPVWRDYLQQGADGMIGWSQPSVPGRLYPLLLHFRPGRLIVLEETSPAVLRRGSDPIYVSGTQIVEMPEPAPRSFWSAQPPSPFSRLFLEQPR